MEWRIPRTSPAVVLALAAALMLPAGAQAAFPGQNGKIAFMSDRDGNFDVYAMSADGSGQVNRTNNPVSDVGAGVDFRAAWSPDGQKIAFSSKRDGNSEVYVMSADGSGQVNRTNNPAFDVEPAWSPDGQKIAFRTNRDGNDEIYVMNADGSGQVRRTNNPADDVEPAWSPDGQKIAFRTNRDEFNTEIYVMSADGSGQVRRTNNPALEAEPAWSPDGQKIAFRSTRDGNNEIYVMNADGSGQVNRTSNPAPDFEPAWSPDGQKIAFKSTRDGNDEIYVMNANGSGQTRLTNNPAEDRRPDWQPISACPDVRVGLAVAQGCFERSSPGSALFETRERAWVGGFEIQPRSGGKLILNTEEPPRLVAQGVVDVVFEGERLPIPVSALPVNVPDATIELNQPGTIEKILFELPMKGSAKVAWTDGGKGSGFEAELEIEKLTDPIGQLVTLSAGESVEGASGKLRASLANGRGFQVDSAELRINKIDVLPRRLRIPRVVGLRNILLRFERRCATAAQPCPPADLKPFWTGQAGISFPLTRGELVVTGRVFVFDRALAGGGLTVDGFNRRLGGTPIFLQKVSGDLLFAPRFGFELGVGATFGPRVNGKALQTIDGQMKGGELAASDCTAGDDPSSMAFQSKLTPLEALAASGLVEVEVSGRTCFFAGTVPAFEVTQQSKIEFLGGALGYEGSQVGFVSTRGANLEGAVLLRLPLLPDLNGQAILSTRGLAACTNLTFFQGGFGYSWGQAGTPSTFTGCDLGPFRVNANASAPRARAAARLRVRRGLPHAAFAATASGGAPRVKVTGPGGFGLTTPAGNGTLRSRRAVVVPVAQERTTYVIVNNPRGGTWRVESVDAGRPLTRVRVARGLPKPSVKARVRKVRAKKRTRFRLRYTVRPIPGQRVVFTERGAGIAKRLGRARGRKGSITFKPTIAARRGRRIEAEVTQDGLPRALLTVARFRAPARPKLIRPRIKAKRAKSSLALSWGRVTGAERYLVEVRAGARTLLGPLVTSKRSLRLKRTPANGNLRVTVRAFSTSQPPGPTAKKTVKPFKKKTRKRERR